MSSGTNVTESFSLLLLSSTLVKGKALIKESMRSFDLFHATSGAYVTMLPMDQKRHDRHLQKPAERSKLSEKKGMTS